MEDLNFSGETFCSTPVNRLLHKTRRWVFIAISKKSYVLCNFFPHCLCPFVTSGCLHLIVEYVLCSKAFFYLQGTSCKERPDLQQPFRNWAYSCSAKSWKICLCYRPVACDLVSVLAENNKLFGDILSQRVPVQSWRGLQDKCGIHGSLPEPKSLRLSL